LPALLDPHGPWIVKSLPCETSPSYPGWLHDLIGEPPEAVASELKSRDFLFLTRDAKQDRVEVVAAAERLVDQIPSLSLAVRSVVREVFLLSAREEYDVSHSEPRWRNWIFVSAPGFLGPVAGLRLAENVVHEAMHLQLTELEARMPLVADAASKLHSPWKQEPRQLQGILHGLYVFACISAFFGELLRNATLSGEEAAYIHRRLGAIGDEVATVPAAQLAQGLSEAGKLFLDAITPHPFPALRFSQSRSRQPPNNAKSGL
jgi:HEXXH motif-containing protein